MVCIREPLFLKTSPYPVGFRWLAEIVLFEPPLIIVDV